MSLKEVCRACLGTGRTMCSALESIVPTFDSPPNSVLELWKIFNKILIDYEGRFPNKICIECLDEIQRTYSFVIKCGKTEEILKKMKKVRICLKNLKIITVSCDISKNIKSENEIYPNLSQIKTENTESIYGYDEEGTENGQLEAIILANISSQVDPLLQHTLIVQDEVHKSGIKPLDSEHDARENDVSARQETEFNKSMVEDEFDEAKSQDKSSIELFKCPACRYECRIMESLEKHFIDNHMADEMCKLCNKEFECKPIEHCFEHLHLNRPEMVLQSTNIKHHKCIVCSKIFRHKCNLKRHLMIHSGERPFKCEICPKTFRDASHLKRHLINHTGARPFKCGICTKSYHDQHALTKHLRCHAGKRLFNCEICMNNFRHKNTLMEHLRGHTEEWPFKCENCPKTFQRKTHLSRHSRKHLEMKAGVRGYIRKPEVKDQICVIIHANADSQVGQKSKYTSVVQHQRDNFGIELFDHVDCNDELLGNVSTTPDIKNEPELDICMEEDDFDEIESEDESSTEILLCPTCRYECKIMESMEKHFIGNHMEEKRCNLCNKEFKCEPIEHCATHLHTNRSKRGIKSTNIKHYKCKICSKIFRHKCNLTRHLILHTGERPFKCEMCPKTFRDKNHLTRHLMIHTGEKPIKCEFCTKSFHDKHALTQHLRCHTGERPYKCEICMKDFRQKYHLMGHSRCHTGERPFKCKICPKAFILKGLLTMHLKSHTGERSFKCEICPKAFLRKTGLAKHLRKHSEENTRCARKNEVQEQFEVIIHTDADCRLDQKSQDTSICMSTSVVQNQGKNSGNQLFDHLDCNNFGIHHSFKTIATLRAISRRQSVC